MSWNWAQHVYATERFHDASVLRWFPLRVPQEVALFEHAPESLCVVLVILFHVQSTFRCYEVQCMGGAATMWWKVPCNHSVVLIVKQLSQLFRLSVVAVVSCFPVCPVDPV